MRRLVTVLVLAGAIAAGAQVLRGGPTPVGAAPTDSATFVPAPIPTGPEGELIAHGKHIIQQTPAVAGSYVTAAMSCEACHVNAGTKAYGLSLVSVYATYPQWSARAKRFIAVQDRLAECFLNSMNGRPPAFDSREMIALTAYLAYLSRGIPVGTTAPGQGLLAVNAPKPPSAAAGKAVYAASCIGCHGANGAGNQPFPPLWGPTSFNDDAGMNHLATMASFVRSNMPYGAPPNTLTAQQAVDVAAFVLSHPRPKFDRHREIAFPPKPAAYF